MNEILTKLKKYGKRIKGIFPRSLPKGVTELEKFAEDICFTYDFPSLPSYKNAISTMILHLGPTVTRKPALFFARSIHKSMSNQVAYEMIQRIQEEEKAEKAKKLALIEEEKAAQQELAKGMIACEDLPKNSETSGTLN